MYASYTEWRNEIRAAEKSLRLMKQAAAVRHLGIGSYWRSDLSRAIEELERTIKRAKQSYEAEKSAA